ncbi:hypothetical protein MT325_m106R [Paramecium bursaria chlorella virus MT325]|uniref:Uncharacterized protein m106R n=1 Tax=Paramecium bursaria Chlorella virus MT325 TaxID=346932 RepID=A7ITI6_PBCVM|nr:hypothetical protein MT325_m106R [Paramecium bursaria chlorella virus MT325]
MTLAPLAAAFLTMRSAVRRLSSAFLDTENWRAAIVVFIVSTPQVSEMVISKFCRYIILRYLDRKKKWSKKR